MSTHVGLYIWQIERAVIQLQCMAILLLPKLFFEKIAQEAQVYIAPLWPKN